MDNQEASEQENIVEEKWIIAIPDNEPPRFNGGVRCDVIKGPCACGAWH